jgi:carbon-monoxide dehydrogenase medium subunit
VKAAAFEYLLADDIPAALKAIASGRSAKLIAGGQSLGPMLNLRLVRTELLVDISRIDELRTITEMKDYWRIGAGVTHAMLEDAAGHMPGAGYLARVASGIAYRAIRNRGTIGGSLVHADPAADWPLALAALGASIELRGSTTRSVEVTNFMKGTFLADVAPDEIVTAVKVPKLGPNARTGYFKFCRKTGEFPEASAAVVLDPARKSSKVFLGAVSGAPQPLARISTQVARHGFSGLDPAMVAEDIAEAAHDAGALRTMYAAAVSQALKEAFS